MLVCVCCHPVYPGRQCRLNSVQVRRTRQNRTPRGREGQHNYFYCLIFLHLFAALALLSFLSQKGSAVPIPPLPLNGRFLLWSRNTPLTLRFEVMCEKQFNETRTHDLMPPRFHSIPLNEPAERLPDVHRWAKMKPSCIFCITLMISHVIFFTTVGPGAEADGEVQFHFTA